METNGKLRIGVYICHCGTNIYPRVDVEEVAESVKNLKGVVVARHYKYMCSDPGQNLIKEDIRDLKLNRVVVASCSPLLHEHTFRRACQEAGLNPFLFQMANIREQCSWVTEDGGMATEKARRIVTAAIKRVGQHQPLTVRRVSIRSEVLVVGGGITGIEAALRLAGAGRKVYLVEKAPSIGGHMSELDKTFPTLDCSACILTPKLVAVAQNPNIELITYSEVEDVSGFVGNFKVKIRMKPRFVDPEKCTGCGICWSHCPSLITPRARRIRKGDRIISEKKEDVR